MPLHLIPVRLRIRPEPKRATSRALSAVSRNSSPSCYCRQTQTNKLVSAARADCLIYATPSNTRLRIGLPEWGAGRPRNNHRRKSNRLRRDGHRFGLSRLKFATRATAINNLSSLAICTNCFATAPCCAQSFQRESSSASRPEKVGLERKQKRRSQTKRPCSSIFGAAAPPPTTGSDIIRPAGELNEGCPASATSTAASFQIDDSARIRTAADGGRTRVASGTCRRPRCAPVARTRLAKVSHRLRSWLFARRLLTSSLMWRLMAGLASTSVRLSRHPAIRAAQIKPACLKSGLRGSGLFITHSSGRSAAVVMRPRHRSSRESAGSPPMELQGMKNRDE